MTSYEYTALDLNAKAEILWGRGIFLENYLEVDKGTNLYFLDNFYVEVTLNKTEIVDITPFKRGERLDKYLQKINLQETL